MLIMQNFHNAVEVALDSTHKIGAGVSIYGLLTRDALMNIGGACVAISSLLAPLFIKAYKDYRDTKRIEDCTDETFKKNLILERENARIATSKEMLVEAYAILRGEFDNLQNLYLASQGTNVDAKAELLKIRTELSRLKAQSQDKTGILGPK